MRVQARVHGGRRWGASWEVRSAVCGLQSADLGLARSAVYRLRRACARAPRLKEPTPASRVGCTHHITCRKCLLLPASPVSLPLFLRCPVCLSGSLSALLLPPGSLDALPLRAHSNGSVALLPNRLPLSSSSTCIAFCALPPPLLQYLPPLLFLTSTSFEKSLRDASLNPSRAGEPPGEACFFASARPVVLRPVLLRSIAQHALGFSALITSNISTHVHAG